MEKSPLLLALAVPVVALQCPGCSTCAPRSVRVGFEQAFYVVRGSGEPTVVLEADIAAGYSSWQPILDDIASATTTFAYSRPGYAPASVHHRSEANARHTPRDAVARLRRLLGSVELAPPYVLVGHGAGATYMLHYAARFPEEVAGLVLVERTLPGFRDECRAAGVAPWRPPGPWAGRISRHVREELGGVRFPGGTPTARDLGDIPVTVIAARASPAGASEEQRSLRLRLQRRLAEEANDGRFVTAENSGHDVQRDRPDLVIEEVRALVERARSRGARARTRGPEGGGPVALRD